MNEISLRRRQSDARTCNNCTLLGASPLCTLGESDKLQTPEEEALFHPLLCFLKGTSMKAHTSDVSASETANRSSPAPFVFVMYVIWRFHRVNVSLKNSAYERRFGFQ